MPALPNDDARIRVTQSQAVIAGLRALADWLEENPQIEPPTLDMRMSTYENKEAALEEFTSYARAMGNCEKYTNSYEYGLRKVFSKYENPWASHFDSSSKYIPAVVFEFSASHESVCEKIELDEVEEVVEYVPTDEERDRINEAYEEYRQLMQQAKRPVVKQKFEWKCPSVLGDNK